MVAAESRRIRLGELLLRAGVITEDQLRSALAEQKKWGGKLGSVLVDLNYLNEDLLVKALSKQLGLPRVDFKGLAIPPQALEKIDPTFSEQNQVLPVSLDVGRNLLVVALSDPSNLGLADEIAFKTGCRVKVAVAGERSLSGAIREHYFGDQADAPDAVPVEESMEMLSTQGQSMGDAPPAPVSRAPEAPQPPPAPQQAAAPVTIDERLQRLEALQHKEIRVLKTIVELLIDKGFITREEYRQKVE